MNRLNFSKANNSDVIDSCAVAVSSFILVLLAVAAFFASIWLVNRFVGTWEWYSYAALALLTLALWLMLKNLSAIVIYGALLLHALLKGR